MREVKERQFMPLKKTLRDIADFIMPDGQPCELHLCLTLVRMALGLAPRDPVQLKALMYVVDRLGGRPYTAEPDPPPVDYVAVEAMLAESLTVIYGPVTEEERRAVAGQVHEMQMNAAQVREMEAEQDG